MPLLSIVIPSRRGLVEQALDLLLRRQLPDQTFQDFDVHVVVGDDRQGRAINEGVRRSSGRYVGTMDDDIELGDARVLDNLVSLLEADPTVGMTGAACPIPGDASPFQQAALRQIPRRYFPVVTRPTDSDMVQHGCMVMRRDLFLKVGAEDEDLVRGLDPIVRTRVRDLGFRVVVAPKTWFYHRPPSTAANLLRMYFRNGRGSAFAALHFPDRVFELGDGWKGGDFPLHRPLAYRVGRRLWRLGEALVGGRWVRLAVDTAYITGFTTEWLGRSSAPPKLARQVRHERTLGDRIHVWRSVALTESSP